VVDLSPIIALLTSIGTPWALAIAAVLYVVGPKLVPILQRLLAKAPGGVPVVPVSPVAPVTPPVAPVAPDNRPILDALSKVLLDLLAKRAAKEGKAVETVVAEYVADEVK
jgi:hypothetical protein